MEMPSKQMSVTDRSTTTIWVSNTSEPTCIRQKTAARREPNRGARGVYDCGTNQYKKQP